MNSRTKGNKGERIAAKVVGAWTNKKFARVPSSGGLQWKNTNAKGDIVCTEEGHFFPFCMEIKNYKDLNFQHLVYNVKSDIMKFWTQCIRDAEIAKKAPMLWMRYNGLPKTFFFIMVETTIYEDFFKPYLTPDDHIMVLPTRGLVVLTTDYLDKIPYKKIRKAIKSRYR